MSFPGQYSGVHCSTFTAVCLVFFFFFSELTGESLRYMRDIKNGHTNNVCLIILLWCLDLYSEGKFTTLSLTQLGLWWSFSRSVELIHRYFSSLVFSYCPQFNGNLKASSFTGHECLIRKSNTTFYSHA